LDIGAVIRRKAQRASWKLEYPFTGVAWVKSFARFDQGLEGGAPAYTLRGVFNGIVATSLCGVEDGRQLGKKPPSTRGRSPGRPTHGASNARVTGMLFFLIPFQNGARWISAIGDYPRKSKNP
jgi:hypothetical protein